MPPLTSKLTDLQTGRYSTPSVVSQSHGRKQAPMIQTINITPKLTLETDGQWGTIPDVISVQTYQNSAVVVDWKYSNLKTLEDMLWDLNPATGNVYDAGQMFPVDLFYNDLGKNQNKQYAGRLLVNCTASANTTNGDLNTSRKRALNATALLDVETRGVIIQYSRFVNSPAFSTSEDIAFIAGVGTYASSVTAINGASNYVLAAKQQTGGVTTWFVDNTQFSSLFTSTTTTFTPTGGVATGDVWEVYTVVTPS